MAFESHPRPFDESDVLTASILRELPAARASGETGMYRMVIACNTATHEGGMQLAWAPVPKLGTLSATVDGGTPLVFKVESTEKMGNGSQTITAGAAISLSQNPSIPLPAKTLRIANLFPNESVEFPFGDLPQSLAACFKRSTTAQ